LGGVSWAFLMGLKWRISASIELLLSSLSHLLLFRACPTLFTCCGASKQLPLFSFPKRVATLPLLLPCLSLTSSTLASSSSLLSSSCSLLASSMLLFSSSLLSFSSPSSPSPLHSAPSSPVSARTRGGGVTRAWGEEGEEEWEEVEELEKGPPGGVKWKSNNEGKVGERGVGGPGSRKPRACEPGSQIVCLPADNF